MAVITIVGAGMMGSALAFPARENQNEVRLVGTHLDKEIIDDCTKYNRHPKFNKEFPAGIKFYQIEQLMEAIEGSDVVIGGVSSFGVEWFADNILPIIPENVPVLTVTKGLMDSNCKISSLKVFVGCHKNCSPCLKKVYDFPQFFTLGIIISTDMKLKESIIMT